MSTSQADADQALFDAAVHYACMRAMCRRNAVREPERKRKHLYDAARYEWSVVNLAIKAELQAERRQQAQGALV